MNPVEGHEDPVVSWDDDNLILIDPNDEKIGTMQKTECHLKPGHLHRAVSIFIFNGAGEILLQRRSSQKMLWPGYWSNACCSHPREGESYEIAVHRRLEQELGINTRLSFLYKFVYKAAYEDIGVEHELCSVWVGRAEASNITANGHEISDWRFFKTAELNHNVSSSPGDYTPWMKMEWSRITSDFSNHCGPVS